MRLCFDATKFGCGLTGAVELAAHVGIPALEYAFEAFPVNETKKNYLSTEEKTQLESVLQLCHTKNVEIACIKLNYPTLISSKDSVNHFILMMKKLVAVAKALNCSQLLFYLVLDYLPEHQNNWVSFLETTLKTAIQDLKEQGIRPVLSLSTPSVYRGLSLRFWRSSYPHEWRELLATIPDLTLSFSIADCIWQGIDYVQVLADFAQVIEHVEAQDVEINRQLITESGLFGPLWWRYRKIGKGIVDWKQFIETLKLYGYQGTLSIQLDDEFARNNEEELKDSLESSIKLLTPLIKY